MLPTFVRWLRRKSQATAAGRSRRDVYKPFVEFLEVRNLLSFVASPSSPFTISTGYQPDTVAIADFNGDGKMDMAVGGSQTPGSVVVLQGVGDGTFLFAGTPIPAGNASTGFLRCVTTADLDGDGKLDILSTNFNGTLTVYQNVTTGIGATPAFVAQTPVTVGNGPFWVSTGDLDGDTKLDAVVASFSGNNITILRNTSTGVGNFSFASTTVSMPSAGPRSVVIADFDGDTKLDWATANFNNSTLSFFRNTTTAPGSITFTQSNLTITGAKPMALTVGDFNGDHAPDLAAASFVNTYPNPGSAYVLLNQAGTFSTFTTVPVSSQPIHLTNGDFNGDGNLDLAVVSFDSPTQAGLGSMRVVYGNGAGAFSNPETYGLGTSPRWVAAGDLNGDGAPDLVVPNSTSGGGSGVFPDSLSLFSNQAAAGAFLVTPSTTTPVAGVPFSVTVKALSGGNAYVNYIGTVNLTSTDAGAPNLGSHTFVAADHGSFTFTVTLPTVGTTTINAGDSTSTGNAPVTVLSRLKVGAVQAAPYAISLNGSSTLSGSILEANPAATFTLQVNWGDGSPVQTFNYAAGAATFSEPHTFLQHGTLPVQLTMNDSDGNVATARAYVGVMLAPPTLTNVQITPAISQNGVATLTGTFGTSDPQNAYTLVVNWGDNTPRQTFNYPAGTTSFSETHTYSALGDFSVSLSLGDSDHTGALLYGGDTPGNLMKLNLATGAGTLVGQLPNGELNITEVSYDNFQQRAWLEYGGVLFQGQEFNLATAAAIGSPFNNVPGRAFTGLSFNGGTLYGSGIPTNGGTAPSDLRILDPLTGLSSLIGQTGINGPLAGLAYDDRTGNLYGIRGGNVSTNNFVQLNLSTGIATTLFSTNFVGAGLAFGPDGVLYAGSNTGQFYKIDLVGHSATLIGTTGFGNALSGLMLVDPRPKTTASASVNVYPSPTHFSIVSLASTPTAGDPFVFSISALDQFGTATGYTGTVHFSSSDSQANLPPDVTLNNGLGFFAAILKTAGSQSLTAVDKSNSALTGSAGPIVVQAAALHHLAIAVPTTAATGMPFNFTTSAFDNYGNLLPNYTGTVHFASTDGAATIPADSKLTSGTGTFSATLRTIGNQLLLVTDAAATSITGSSLLITARGLLVNDLTPTPTGFVATFNKAVDPSVLNLYDSMGAYGPADVTVAGPSGPVRGSLLLDPANNAFTFIKTGVGATGLFAGLLPAGTYTVTFRSAPNAFKDLDGGLLDGNNDGVPGDDFQTSFTVAASSTALLSIADFARGPNGTANIKIPNASGSGVPITLSNAANATDVTFALHYNPALLNITGTLSNTAGTFTLVGTPSNGVANFSFHANTPISGTKVLGQIVAQVPDSAATKYKGKQLLHLSDILIDGNATGIMNDDGVQAVAYIGDATGDGSLSPLDAALNSRVATVLDSGFAAYRLLDPAVITDLNGNGFSDSGDVTLMNRFLAGINVPQLATAPAGLSIAPTGPDPTLSLPTNLVATPGTAVVVPLHLDTATPQGSLGLMEAVLALKYDPKVFTVSASDVHLGSLPASGSGWKLSAAVNAQTGEIGIDLYSPTPIVSTGGGSLVTLTLHVLADAPAGASGINLVRSVNPTGQRAYVTTASDAAGPYILHPAVTDGGDDHGVDGMVLVPTTSAQLSLSTETVPQTFYVGQSSPAGSATAALPAMASISTSGHELALGLIERILGDQEALNLHYQLQDSDAIRAHLDASNTQELDRGVSMLTHPLTQDNWMPEDCLDYLIQERRRNAKSPWTELWDSEVAVDTQNQTD